MLLGILAGGAALVAFAVAIGACRRRSGSAGLGEGSRALFEAHPLPMWVFEPGTLRLLAVNDAAIARYGYAREEFLRMTLADLRAPEDVPALMAAHTSPERGHGPRASSATGRGAARPSTSRSSRTPRSSTAGRPGSSTGTT